MDQSSKPTDARRGVKHPRVAHVKRDPFDVYVGRGRCPCRKSGSPCAHERHGRGAWGNPFTVERYGVSCMWHYFDWLEDNPTRVACARAALAGLVLGCWCKGRYPVCHAEVLARLADGEPMADIRADMVARLSPPDEPGLFGALP